MIRFEDIPRGYFRALFESTLVTMAIPAIVEPLRGDYQMSINGREFPSIDELALGGKFLDFFVTVMGVEYALTNGGVWGVFDDDNMGPRPAVPVYLIKGTAEVPALEGRYLWYHIDGTFGGEVLPLRAVKPCSSD